MTGLPLERPRSEMPPLALALVAMTALQALVALALFTPGILAPVTGTDAGGIALFSAACFAVGMPAALMAGRLTRRFGAFGTAALCMLAIAAGMVVAGQRVPLALLIAGLLTGLAFGPETPASSSLLGRIATERQRPLVFSLRQTGNQLGAIVGSLLLPVLAFAGPSLPLMAVAAAALLAAAVYAALERRYPTRSAGAGPDLRASFDLMRRSRTIGALALACAPMSAMQLGLNAFLVTHLVNGLAFEHVTAGLVLGVAQAGGLAGRLGWGFVVGRFCDARQLLAGLAAGMALFAALIAFLPAQTPLPLLFPVAFAFGLTASGWNGIFLAEIAGLSPEGRIGDVTGAVLVASYAGLFVAPLVISLFARFGGMRLSYLVLALLAGLAALIIARVRNART